MLDKLLTTKELADYLKVNEMTIYKLYFKLNKFPLLKSVENGDLEKLLLNYALKSEKQIAH